jgi:hypothetical protein
MDRYRCYDEQGLDNDASSAEMVNVIGATPKQAIEWVQVMSEIPADQNPLLDPTGEYAEFGDVGKTQYLAGTLEPGEAQRSFEVDSGDTLVLPLINVWTNEIESDGIIYDTVKDAARASLEDLDPNEVYLKIDLNYKEGKDTPDIEKVFDVSDASYFPELSFPENDSENASEFYVESGEEFSITIPENNIYEAPAGDYGGFHTVGYYAQIKNLPEGTHKIEFGSTVGDDGEEFVAVTDIITVGDSSYDYFMS